MLDWLGAAQEQIKENVLISGNHTERQRIFADLFRDFDEINVQSLDPKTVRLWTNITHVCSIIRKRPGASMLQLEARTKIPKNELRRCMRVILNLGGEVEFITGQEFEEGFFFLHN